MNKKGRPTLTQGVKIEGGMKGDYHIHTNYSDGVFSPEKIVDLALEAGLKAISLTDHDNVLSYNIAVEYLKTKEVEMKVIQGIEVNTLYKDYEVHILGYFPDTTKSDFKNLLKIQQQARTKQTKEILALLSKKEGIKIKYEDVKNMVAEGGSIGRPHIAKAITNAGGTSNVMEAYSKYIHRNSPVYVERKTVSPFDAVEVIYDSGGIPVIAHPYDIDIAEKLIKDLMNCGLRGIEAYHRKHSPAIVEYFSSMAENLGLIVTGGSDFHAPNIMNGQIILGKNFVPEWIYEKLLEEKRRLDLA
ncbi:PHP domain-containing protein [bacterium]|nr:PHP domain-containing protein [bacterium]